MALKYWKKVRDNESGIAWFSLKADELVGVYANPPSYNGEHGWVVTVDGGYDNQKYLSPKFHGSGVKYPNKEKGISIAKSYMRKN